MRFISLLCVLLWSIACALGGEKLPDNPHKFFSDGANLVSATKAQQFEATLAQLEKDTSVEFAVATFPTFDSDSDVADYSQQIAQSWGIGKKGKNNGIVLFIFLKDKAGKTQIRLMTGYGMEGALPDAIAQRICDNDIRPHVRLAKAGGGQKEWEVALEGGINSVIKVAKGEYPAIEVAGKKAVSGWLIFWIIVGVVLIIIILAKGGGVMLLDLGSSFGSSGGSGGGGSFGGGGGGGGD